MIYKAAQAKRQSAISKLARFGQQYSMAGYRVTGPVDCDVDFDTASLAGKTAIVTGGANGIGEAYVRALLTAGCFVCVGDLDAVGGNKLSSEFSDKIAIVHCDTSNWDDQTRLFSKAAELSPTGKIHYVVANAGIWRPDEVFKFEGWCPPVW